MSRSPLKPLQQQEAGRSALAAAALLPEPVDLPLLGALGVSTTTLEQLFDAGVLTPAGPTTARWSSLLSREAAADALAWSERRRLHERIAALLSARPEYLADAARHYVAACCFTEARALLLRDAGIAAAARNYDRAVSLLEQCLSVWPADEERETRGRVLADLARFARNCGRLDVARRALTETHEPTVDTHQQLADLALLAEDFSGAREHLESAARLAEQDGPGPHTARRWLNLASFLADQLRPRDALTALRRARELLGEPRDAALHSELLGYEGLLCAMQGQPAAARDLVQQSLEVAVSHQLPRESALAYRRMANICEYDSDYPGERDAHLHAIALCRKQNESESEQSCLTCLSYVFFRTGEWKRALATIRTVLNQPGTPPALRTGALGVQAMIAAFRGEHRQALARLEETRRDLRRHGVLSLEFHLLWAAAYCRGTSGDTAGAAETYHRLIDTWETTEDRHDVIPGAVSAAAFFADAGETTHLARLTDLMHTLVSDHDTAESRAARSAVLGEVSLVERDWPAALAHFTAARDGYDLLGVAVERTLIRHRFARALVAAGRERDAASERQSALALARRLGMRSVLESVAAGSPTPPALHTLTGRQQEVLRLLAAGLTNKEAADRLHLSPRTVEMHVAGLLDRLNCRTRAAAIRRATELHLLP
jgi:DNA-binding CsgD family transcriptional regulator